MDGYMLKRAVKWSLRQVLRNKMISRYLEEQLSAEILQVPGIRFVPPGHFYSPFPDLEEIEKERQRIYQTPQTKDGIDVNADQQFSLLGKLLAYYPLFDWEEASSKAYRFWLKNDYFGGGDAVILFGILQHFAPVKIIEIGSGFSSALMLDTNEKFCGGRIEFDFIEPHGERLNQLLTPTDRLKVRLHNAPVQKIPLQLFDELQRNDVLFVDSSHVAKVGSDVNHILFQILPRLRTGVLVHFHDVFYPFEYPLEWIREGRAWNEAYILRAFLQYNSQFEVVMFNNLVVQRWRHYVADKAPIMARTPGSSLWLRKKEEFGRLTESCGKVREDDEIVAEE
jgi:hypothetical protein